MDAREISLLKEQRVAYINSLLSEGFLDEQFNQIQMLQDADNPRFVADLIAIYCQESEKTLAELSQSLNEETPDFKKVDKTVHQFKGSSASMGANQVVLACIDLRTYSDLANKDGCKDALNTLKQKFYIIKIKLETLIQMEEKIWALEGGQV